MSFSSDEFNALVGKLKNRCFCRFPAAIFVPLNGAAYMASPHKAFCILIFFYLLDSGLSVSNGLHAILFLIA